MSAQARAAVAQAQANVEISRQQSQSVTVNRAALEAAVANAQAALKAARASLFQPLVRNGAKVPSRFVVTYDFRLES